MKQTKILMNMPITVEIIDSNINKDDIDEVFDYFKKIDNKFSVFIKTSEISQINRGEISETDFSPDMKIVLELACEIKKQTDGYFDIMTKEKKLNPSGLVKGWAIRQVADILINKGYKNFYLEVGGDIQIQGKNYQQQNWQIGIRNPFNLLEIIKIISLDNNMGVATSGIYIRGEHIYNPKQQHKTATEVVSLTVIGPDVCSADCVATTACAMGRSGIMFIENLAGFEGYMITQDKIATMTSGFEKFVVSNL